MLVVFKKWRSVKKSKGSVPVVVPVVQGQNTTKMELGVPRRQEAACVAVGVWYP